MVDYEINIPVKEQIKSSDSPTSKDIAKKSITSKPMETITTSLAKTFSPLTDAIKNLTSSINKTPKKKEEKQAQEVIQKSVTSNTINTSKEIIKQDSKTKEIVQKSVTSKPMESIKETLITIFTPLIEAFRDLKSPETKTEENTKALDTKVSETKTPNAKKSGSSFGKLAGAVAVGSMASKALSVVLSGLMKTLEPLINVLQALFVVAFMPLMPIITDLAKIIGELIPGITKLFGGEIDLAEFVKSYLGPALLGIGQGIIDFIALIAKAGFEIGKYLGKLLVEYVIEPIGHFIAGIIISIGKFIGGIIKNIIGVVTAYIDFWKGLGTKIWDFIKKGLSTIGDLGTKIWDILKTPFTWLKDKLKAIINGIIKVANWVPGVNIGALAKGGTAMGGSPYIVGEKGPELFIPGSTGTVIPNDKMGGGDTITINVSGNTIRSEDDIRKLTDEISRTLQQRANRGYSY